MQRLVLARSVGHGETGFRLRGCVQSMVSMSSDAMYDLYYVLVVVQYLMSYLFHSLNT